MPTLNQRFTHRDSREKMSPGSSTSDYDIEWHVWN